MTSDVQVKKTHYNFNNYSTWRRFVSYYEQLSNIDFNNEIKSVLIIGKGDGVVPAIIQAVGDDMQQKINVYTMDYDADLNPDYVQDITQLNPETFKDRFDLIICCQVLEHIPTKFIESILKSFSEIATKQVIISVPTNPILFNITFKFNYGKLIPILGPLVKKLFKKNGYFGRSLTWLQPIYKHDFDGNHYWHLGSDKMSYKSFEKSLKQYFDINNHYLSGPHGQHYFYNLNPKGA